MKIIIDHQVVRKVVSGEFIWNDEVKSVFLERSAFLECVGLGNVFDTIPKFDDKNIFFSFCTSDLTFNLNKEVITHLYDQIFIECLTDVQNTRFINKDNLYQQIQEKKKGLHAYLVEGLDLYEQRLLNNPQDLIHDLTLYLAWDVVCIRIAILFENISSDSRNSDLLKGLKECLLESFDHITREGKTKPGFFRMIEAFYAYQMRQELLDTYKEEEWGILCKSCKSLMDREQFADVFYLSLESSFDFSVITIDSSEKIEATLLFSEYILEKIKEEFPFWSYRAFSSKIIQIQN